MNWPTYIHTELGCRCHPLHARSTFKLGLRELAMMDNLNVWTHACNISVASALLDCFDAELLARFRGKG